MSETMKSLVDAIDGLDRVDAVLAYLGESVVPATRDGALSEDAQTGLVAIFDRTRADLAAAKVGVVLASAELVGQANAATAKKGEATIDEFFAGKTDDELALIRDANETTRELCVKVRAELARREATAPTPATTKKRGRKHEVRIKAKR